MAGLASPLLLGSQHIYIIDVDGSHRHDLTYGGSAVFAPDGGTIAFERYLGGFSRIFLMNPDGSTVRPLPNSKNGHGPSFGPGEGRILFTRGSNIFVINRDGSHLQQLTHHSGSNPSDLAADFSPNGKQIVFTHFKTPTEGGISVMNADGSHAHRLPNGPGGSLSDLAGGWQPLP
jgi:Tol biopolymer transport system component